MRATYPDEEAWSRGRTEVKKSYRIKDSTGMMARGVGQKNA
ncbi:MAG: hypothetical protein ACP5VS_14685 [Desulfomonilaceae bacterium]